MTLGSRVIPDVFRQGRLIASARAGDQRYFSILETQGLIDVASLDAGASPALPKVRPRAQLSRDRHRNPRALGLLRLPDVRLLRLSLSDLPARTPCRSRSESVHSAVLGRRTKVAARARRRRSSLVERVLSDEPVADGSRDSVHIEISPDNEGPLVTRADLVLQRVGCGMESTRGQCNRLAGVGTRPPGNPGMMDDEQAWPGVGCQRCELFGCRVILCAKRAPVLGQPGEHLQRACLMNQYVTAVTNVDRLFRRTGIARDDDAAVRRVESVPMTSGLVSCVAPKRPFSTGT